MGAGMSALAGVITRLLLALGVAGTAAWGAPALYYGLGGTAPALALSVLFAGLGAAAILAVVARWRRRLIAGAYCLAFACVLAWWQTILPSNDRQWAPEVARLAHVEFDGDLVTVRDIRDFDYRSETDFTPRYYDRTFDLRKLQSVDLIAVYWMGPDIAHTILSFGFEGDQYLAVSIETRKEAGEGYSTLKGFFKQFELYYVVADERDVVRLRTNYRHDPTELTYLYRLRRPLENGRRLFVEYMRRVNELHDRPAFYHTLLTNCTTTIWHNTRVNPGHLKFSWKLLASGHVPAYLHELGAIEPGMSFEALQTASLVNARALAADQAPDFSTRIREGLPGMRAARVAQDQ